MITFKKFLTSETFHTKARVVPFLQEILCHLLNDKHFYFIFQFHPVPMKIQTCDYVHLVLYSMNTLYKRYCLT